MLAKNDAQLMNDILPGLTKVVDYMTKKILEENTELIQKLVYDAYTPEEYERTGEFKEAWSTETQSIRNIVQGKLYYDSRKLTVDFNKGQHGSKFDNTVVTKYLSEIIYEGLSGAIYEPGYAKHSHRFKGQAWTKKRNVWRTLLEWLGPNRIRKLFEEGLKQQGIKYSRHKTSLFVMKE